MLPNPVSRDPRALSPTGARRVALALGLLACAALFVLAGPNARAADEAAQPSAKEMKKKLLQAVQSGDDAALVQVLRKSGSIPGREMTNMLLSTARKLPEQLEDSYWLILDGVAAFRHGDAFTEMGDYIVRNRKEPVSRDLMNALRKSDSKYLGRVIRRILEDGTTDMKLMAVDLAPNAKVRRTVDILLPYLQTEHDKENDGKHPPTILKRRIIMALESLTLQNYGDGVLNWLGWWQANRHKGLKVLRHEAENKESTTSVGPAIDPVRAKELIGLEEMEPGKVLVIRAKKDRRGHAPNYDQIEQVLERLRIPHDIATRDRIGESNFSLKQYDAIFINCCQINEYCQNPEHTSGAFTGNRMHRCVGPGAHDTISHAFTPEARVKLRKWTERGGYLFTEDWMLIDLLAIEWPGYVQPGAGEGGDWNRLEGQSVRIRPSRGFTAHPFLRGVFVPPPKIDWTYDEDEDDLEDDENWAENYDPTVEDDDADVSLDRGRTTVGEAEETPEMEEIPEPDIDLVRHEWKIDAESPSLSIRSKKVEVLIVSPTLDKQCGNPAVAITFPAKKGRVLHVLSHFGKQNSAHDEATLENMLINFLIEVNVRQQNGTR